jgi:hypothetical protein
MNRSSVILSGLFCALLIVPACGGDGGGGGDDDQFDAGGNPGDPDASNGGGDYESLITRSWSIPAGTEFYRCSAVTVSEDIYVNSFRAISPIGTHHTVLSVVDTPSQADGDYNCGANDLEPTMKFASGLGVGELSFPEGVAMKIPAGSQVHLNLHLFNVSDSEVTGTSGTEIIQMDASDVTDEAEVVFGGKYSINLPHDPNNTQDVVGGCRFQQAATLTAHWPHMHQLGRNMKIVHQSNAGNVTIHDDAYDFNEQINYSIDPIQVAAGERFEITCTYLNDTGGTVTFGDSSNSEMCFVGLYRYPATGADIFACTEF